MAKYDQSQDMAPPKISVSSETLAIPSLILRGAQTFLSSEVQKKKMTNIFVYLSLSRSGYKDRHLFRVRETSMSQLASLKSGVLTTGQEIR